MRPPPSGVTHAQAFLSLSAAIAASLAGAALVADEGMWRLDQLPLDQIQRQYGVKLAPADLARVQGAVVRISTGGTGTFASANGLILTNHHVALDCIRTSTLAEQGKGKAENLVEDGFTAASPADEIPCKRFRAQVEVGSRDVTADLAAAVKPGMDVAAIQQTRMAARSDLERACQKEKGDNYSCAVADFNSGSRSLLIVYEDYKDIRLVYAPEKQLGYFGGDETNFRFPRYVSDISILRAYQAKDGSPPRVRRCQRAGEAPALPARDDDRGEGGRLCLRRRQPWRHEPVPNELLGGLQRVQGDPEPDTGRGGTARAAPQVREPQARLPDHPAEPDLRRRQRPQVQRRTCSHR